MNGESLYRRLMNAGITGMDHHYSDLYVPVSAAAEAIINQFRKENETLLPTKLMTFKSLIPGDGRYYDIPYSYDPYWSHPE